MSVKRLVAEIHRSRNHQCSEKVAAVLLILLRPVGALWLIMMLESHFRLLPKHFSSGCPRCRIRNHQNYVATAWTGELNDPHNATILLGNLVLDEVFEIEFHKLPLTRPR
jgi:hypothetical protein